MGNNVVHVNLLPSAIVWRRLMLKRIRQWGCVYCLMGISILGWNSPLLGKWWNGLSELREMQSASEPIRQMQSDQVRQSQEAVALEKKTSQLRAAICQDRTNALLGIVAIGARSTDDAIQIQEMQMLVSTKSNEAIMATGPNQSPPVASKPARHERQLTLRGIATEGEAITALMESLKDSQVFEKVELRSTQGRFVSEKTVQEFQLECLSYE